jgi:hypothetical protein
MARSTSVVRFLPLGAPRLGFVAAAGTCAADFEALVPRAGIDPDREVCRVWRATDVLPLKVACELSRRTRVRCRAGLRPGSLAAHIGNPSSMYLTKSRGWPRSPGIAGRRTGPCSAAGDGEALDAEPQLYSAPTPLGTCGAGHNQQGLSSLLLWPQAVSSTRIAMTRKGRWSPGHSCALLILPTPLARPRAVSHRPSAAIAGRAAYIPRGRCCVKTHRRGRNGVVKEGFLGR